MGISPEHRGKNATFDKGSWKKCDIKKNEFRQRIAKMATFEEGLPRKRDIYQKIAEKRRIPSNHCGRM